MLVLLPPSETKAHGGEGPPLNVDALSTPALNPVRRELLTELHALAADVPRSLTVLGLSQRQCGEVRRNAELFESATAPTLRRYTGVLYDALDVDSFSPAQYRRAGERIAVASALFGLLAGHDMIPAYRLSAATTLPTAGALRALWRPVIEPLLAQHTGVIVDLRSGAYRDLARVPGAVQVRVLAEQPDGSRKVVSHHNKAHKGRLARALATAKHEPRDIDGVAAVAESNAMRVERREAHHLDVIIG